MSNNEEQILESSLLNIKKFSQTIDNITYNIKLAIIFFKSTACTENGFVCGVRPSTIKLTKVE